MAEAVGEAATLEFTPTWIVAAVCSLIVLISLLAERCLHYLGKTFKRKNQKPLYEAILKVKEELMLLGFISLLLTVFQGKIQKTCISPGWALHMLPCKREEKPATAGEVRAHEGAFCYYIPDHQQNREAAAQRGRSGRRDLPTKGKSSVNVP